jgi:hypothetical protein
MREMAVDFDICCSSSVSSIWHNVGGTIPPFEPPFSLPLFDNFLKK